MLSVSIPICKRKYVLKSPMYRIYYNKQIDVAILCVLCYASVKLEFIQWKLRIENWKKKYAAFSSNVECVARIVSGTGS